MPLICACPRSKQNNLTPYRDTYECLKNILSVAVVIVLGILLNASARPALSSPSPNWTYSHRSLPERSLFVAWSFLVLLRTKKLSPDPFMMLMMHYSVSFTSLASPNHFFDAFLTLLLNALPHQAQGSTSQKVASARTPPHTPFIHFVHPKNSSLAYRLAFVIYLHGH